MPQGGKPNFRSYGNKKSGGPKKPRPQKDAISGVTRNGPSKRQTGKTHHDGLKGNRGNGGGRGR